MEQKFNEAGWSVEYRKLDVCVRKGGQCYLICQKYWGGTDYNSELEKGFNAMIDKGIIDRPTSINHSGNPFINNAKKKYLTHKLKGEESPSCKPTLPPVRDIHDEILNNFTKALEMIYNRNIP